MGYYIFIFFHEIHDCLLFCTQKDSSPWHMLLFCKLFRNIHHTRKTQPIILDPPQVGPICVCVIAAMKSFWGDLLKLQLKYWRAAALIFVINMEALSCWVSCDFHSGILSQELPSHYLEMKILLVKVSRVISVMQQGTMHSQRRPCTTKTFHTKVSDAISQAEGCLFSLFCLINLRCLT